MESGENKKTGPPFPGSPAIEDSLRQPGDPLAADPWLSVPRLLEVWLFHE